MKGALRVLNIAPDAKRVADIRPVVSEGKPTMKVKQEHADA
jgi:hypothetical protein